MTRMKSPACGDWLKLVESLAMKKHGEYGEEVVQGDLFRFLGLSAAEGFCECYSIRLNDRFWVKLEYLLPVKDTDLISLLEPEVPQEFKQPLSSAPSFETALNSVRTVQQKTKEHHR